MRYLILLLCIFAATALHAQGDMRVYTVAGGGTSLGDGGPATSAGLSATEGVWLDADCNLYITDLGNRRIRKVDFTTNLISSICGTTNGFSGDGGPATNAQIRPYGLFVDVSGNVFIADAGNKRIRKINATTGIITTIAGGGTSMSDGVPATDAQFTDPGYIYVDNAGNLYIGDINKIRKLNISTGIITTIVGNGVIGLSGDGGPAINAQVHGPAGMLLDSGGNLIFADRANHRIRKINKTTGIITTIAGSTNGFSGDGGPATASQLSGPICFVIDIYNNIVVGDNQNNVIRKVDASTGIITTIAGVGPTTSGSTAEGALATATEIHPEFMYLDLHGNIYYSTYGPYVRKITNYYPGLEASGSVCGPPNEITAIKNPLLNIYPNPTNHRLHIDNLQTNADYRILSIVGATIQQGHLRAGNNELNIRDLPPGMYLLEVNEDGKRTIQKIIKEQ